MSDQGSGAVEQGDARLDALERRIQRLEARLAAAERGEPGPHFADSGTIHPELDDQTIAP